MSTCSFLWVFTVYIIVCNGYHCIVSSNGDRKNSDARLLSGFNDPLGPNTYLSYFDQQLKLGATKLFPGLLRHPGGTYANYWSFKNASYVTPCNTSYYDYCSQQNKIESLPPQTLSPSNFSEGVGSVSPLNPTKHNAHSISFNLNIYTLSDDELLDQFDYINYNKFNNVNAKYYELGNELYLSRYDNIIPNSTYYMEKVQPLIKKIRSEASNAQIAASVAPRMDYTDSWQKGVAKYNSTYDSVIIHDYSCGIQLVNNLSQSDQASFIAIYGQSMIPQWVEYTKNMFGKDKTIWMTEFNLGLNSHAFNTTIMESVVHAMFAMSYVTASICHSDTMELLMYHTWGVANPTVDHALIRLSAQSNDIKNETFGVMGQLYAHLSWISMIKNDQMTCLNVNQDEDNCPGFDISVKGKKGLKCVFGTGFSNSSNSNSFGFLIENACGFEIGITLNLNGIAKIDKDGVVLERWTYFWNQIGDPGYTKFTNCNEDEDVWNCGVVKPEYSTVNIKKSQLSVNMTLPPLSLILSTTT